MLNLGRDADWRDARWLGALCPSMGAFPFRGIMLAIPSVPCSSKRARANRPGCGFRQSLVELADELARSASVGRPA